MTGRGREVADLMARRRIQVLCVQETRWKGNSARELGDGFKLFYSGTDSRGRNGVGIVLDKEMKTKMRGINRRSDRVMSVKLQLDDMEINVLSTYAPQVGCDDEEKEAFWREVEQEVTSIPSNERIIFGGDLNGHIGKGNTEETERIRGIWGTGTENEEGTKILDFALASDLAILNTYFQKKEALYITYKSGNRTSQIDFMLCRRRHLKEVKNCKIINGESVTPQHRVLVIDVMLEILKKRKYKCTVRKIKWWKLKDPIVKCEFKNKVLENLRTNEVEDQWKRVSGTIREAGEKVLGRTSGKGPPPDKETWWWNEEVKESVKKKKEAKKKWDKSGRQEDKEEYKKANKETKRVVARAKARELNDLYDELDTPEGERNIYRIAKSREKAKKDFTHIKEVKDKDGKVLKSEKEIKERWKDYFNTLMNEENPRIVCERGKENQGVVMDIEREEVVAVLKRMKNNKATGPDEIPIEAWKSLGEEGEEILLGMMREVFREERIPDEWRDSVVVPIYKEKGDIQDCNNYRGIKLMSHTMKMYERIIDRRIRKEVNISAEQFGFMPGRSTTDAIFALRQLIEVHQEKEKPLTCIFIDLEKAYDRVPREEISRCMREKGLPEKYVRIVEDMYDRTTTRVRSSVGVTEQIPVKVGLHQGSALSPFLFDIIMDVLSDHVRKEAPWCMMFADDVVLCGTNAEEMEEELECWRVALEERGLRLNRAKTVQLNILNEGQRIQLDGEELNTVEKFKYLGSTIDKNGSLDCEITHRINAGWFNWKRMTGILCDKRMKLSIKGKIYRSVVRPAMLYGAETWPVKKVQEKRMEVAEMRMLRWSCGVTRMDRIRNEVIRNKIKVTEITNKIQERRLQWFGHIERRDQDYIGKKIREMRVVGNRKRGRPKKKWMNCVNEDLRNKGLTGVEVNDRADWKRLTKNADPV
ncbi:hypothetical protein M8J77_012470 [Diaphorina citri]|nr:hypothetical protein M8J77_012470 [Diaphorina citri]